MICCVVMVEVVEVLVVVDEDELYDEELEDEPPDVIPVLTCICY